MGPREPSRYAWTVLKTEATLALTGMGFKKHEARELIDFAAEQLPRDTSVELLIRKALHRSRHRDR